MPRFAGMLTPHRRRGVEYLDEPGVDATVVRRSLRDVALSNRLFGGTRVVLAELAPALAEARRSNGNRPAALSLLDVGTGLGDIPARARTLATKRGIRLTTFGVEGNEALARLADAPVLPMIRGDALSLPLRDRSVDIVMCSQLLHHFDSEKGVALLRELDRVARRRVIVSDLRRSWLAAAGIWLASWLLLFHPVSRHDGFVSVLRGFTGNELRDLVRRATARVPTIRLWAGFRISATWNPLEGV
ncbi:MAG: methyltransferase domain-containing protein [Gemmatimonadota bacterium]|nr:methyltransferase domain-containing protein [Gemmatimonadota bacterium]